MKQLIEEYGLVIVLAMVGGMLVGWMCLLFHMFG